MAKKTKDSLGDRMKANYENRNKTYLTRRTAACIRLDGVHWHSFTRGFQRPYDAYLHEAMNETMMYLCQNIMGCKFGYTQSDEITLILTDYDTLQTEAWFNYCVEKCVALQHPWPRWPLTEPSKRLLVNSDSVSTPVNAMSRK